MIARKNKFKSLDEIAHEWDLVASQRSAQLEGRQDLSMDYVLSPTIRALARDCNTSAVVDLGCGTGYFTNRFSVLCKEIVGIDISAESVSTAKQLHSKPGRTSFYQSSVEDFGNVPANLGRFSLGVANMLLMDAPNLSSVMDAISKLIASKGHLIFTITHPYFWPFYWNYADQEWFTYDSEIEIEGDFVISKSKTSFTTTHYHRPLSMYINEAVENKFEIIEIIEPMPEEQYHQLYPQRWKFPRFLAVKCLKK